MFSFPFRIDIHFLITGKGDIFYEETPLDQATTGGRIKNLRRKFRLSELAFAQNCNLTVHDLISLERNERQPDADLLALFSDKYQVDSSWFSEKGEDSEERDTRDCLALREKCNSLEKLLQAQNKSLHAMEETISLQKILLRKTGKDSF